jgi:hypothetical protein
MGNKWKQYVKQDLGLGIDVDFYALTHIAALFLSNVKKDLKYVKVACF